MRCPGCKKTRKLLEAHDAVYGDDLCRECSERPSADAMRRGNAAHEAGLDLRHCIDKLRDAHLNARANGGDAHHAGDSGRILNAAIELLDIWCDIQDEGP